MEEGQDVPGPNQPAPSSPAPLPSSPALEPAPEPNHEPASEPVHESASEPAPEPIPGPSRMHDQPSPIPGPSGLQNQQHILDSSQSTQDQQFESSSESMPSSQNQTQSPQYHDSDSETPIQPATGTSGLTQSGKGSRKRTASLRTGYGRKKRERLGRRKYVELHKVRYKRYKELPLMSHLFLLTLLRPNDTGPISLVKLLREDFYNRLTESLEQLKSEFGEAALWVKFILPDKRFVSGGKLNHIYSIGCSRPFLGKEMAMT